MIITMFVNKSYLQKKYNMSFELLNKFTYEVLPNLLNRLSTDSRVRNIEVYTNDSLNKNIGFGSKVKIVKIESSDIILYQDLIDLSIKNKSINNNEEIIVIYNPLFPFLSLDKIDIAYRKIVNAEYVSSIGVDGYYTSTITNNNAELFDAGIFSIFTLDSYKKSNRRVNQPILSVNLSALELISLREKGDYELYGLVVNSGLMK
jgi:hypothetical protein